MNKKVIISKCDNCPYFDNQYYTYEETCKLLDRKIPVVKEPNEYLFSKFIRPIPDDCPLEDTDEDVFNDDKIEEN